MLSRPPREIGLKEASLLACICLEMRQVNTWVFTTLWLLRLLICQVDKSRATDHLIVKEPACDNAFERLCGNDRGRGHPKLNSLRSHLLRQ